MLFITFVENAVKHGADPGFPTFVHLDFYKEDQQIIFTCHNSKPRKPLKTPSGQGGLGLTNIRRRLALLYPGNHSLNIQESLNTFSITLILQK